MSVLKRTAVHYILGVIFIYAKINFIPEDFLKV